MVFDREPRSNRGIVAAIVGITIALAFALGAYVTAISYPKQERYQSYGQSQADQQGSVVPNAAPPPQNKTPCIRPQTEGESDLCAQWRAARAAEQSADWTRWGVLASIVGISFLLWQIMLTRKAVADTTRATDAMNKANEIAAATQRAWIDIVPIVEIRPINSERVYVKTHGEFKNIGKSIANSVYIMTRFIAAPSGEVMNAHNELFRKMIKEGGGRTLMPGKSRSGGQTTNGFSRNQVKWDESGRAVFCMITIATYNIEGSSRRRYSRAMWRLRVGGGEFSNGMIGLTWDEFVGSSIEVDPQSSIDCN